MDKLVSEDERSLFGDKAYAREALKQTARQRGWYYRILDKAKRGAPLSAAQKKRNKPHQRVRAQVEHPFAAIKDRYGVRWARAKTKARNQARFVMAAICWNIGRNPASGRVKTTEIYIMLKNDGQNGRVNQNQG